MKKIFKFVFVFLLFTIFNNVNASVSLKYSDTTLNDRELNVNRINKIHDYIENNLSDTICSSGNCVSGFINKDMPIVARIYYFNSNSNLYYYNVFNIPNYFRSFYTGSSFNIGTVANKYISLLFTFDNNDNIINFAYNGGNSSGNLGFNVSIPYSNYNTSDDILLDFPLESNITQLFYDTYFTSPTRNVIFQSNSSYTNVPYKFFNSDDLYNVSNTINLKEFYDSFSINVEPLNCSKNEVLGFLSNVSDFTFRIKGESNALAEPIRGQLQFNYPNDITITDSDFSVELIQYSENEVDGSYTIKCPDSVKACYIEYSYNYIDDITSPVDFGLKISFTTNVLPRYIQLYNCFHNDTYDYYNISYTYTNSSSSSSNNDSVISNFLQDGSQPDLDGLIDTSLIGDGPVDSILLLPLNIMNTLLNVLNSNTCRPLVLPLPFVNRNMTLPCISTIYSQISGLDTFLNWFSAIMSAFILYEYFIRLYKWVDDTLTFRENNHFGGF